MLNCVFKIEGMAIYLLVSFTMLIKIIITNKNNQQQ